jgi:putative flippase GtrA
MIAVKKNYKKIIKFIIVGSVGIFLNFFIYTALFLLGFNYIIASSIAWLAAFIIGAVLNQKFTFGVQNLKGVVILSTFPVYLLTQGITLYSLSIVEKTFHLGGVLAYAIVLPFAVALNYLALRHFVGKWSG